LIYLALLGFLLVNTVYLQQVRGLTALKTGAAMLPCSFMLATGSLLSGRLLGRLGARPVLLAGAISIAAAFAALTRITPTTGAIQLGAA